MNINVLLKRKRKKRNLGLPCWRAQLVKNLPAMQETPVRFLGQENPLEKDRLPTPVFLGFLCGSADNESSCKAGDLSSIPVLKRCPGEGKGYPLQYSGLENSMDCIVHGAAKSRTRLSNFHFQSKSEILSQMMKLFLSKKCAWIYF